MCMAIHILYIYLQRKVAHADMLLLKHIFILLPHETASDAKYWTTGGFFIAMTTLWLEKSAPAQDLPVIQCFCGFLRIAVH